MATVKRLEVVPYDPAWPDQFRALAAALRTSIGSSARIDHVGSTAVRGLAAKNVLDIQVGVHELGAADSWPEELLPGLRRRPQNDSDHVPTRSTRSAAQWEKRMWSKSQAVHVHVREIGRANHRYALLFRDYLRAEPLAAGAYEALKRALATRAPDDWETYYEVKDPACDLIYAGAEHWAVRTSWVPSEPDG